MTVEGVARKRQPTARQRLLSAAGRLAVATGFHRRLLGDRGVVVAFHRVNDWSAGDGLTVSVADFDAYCAFFARAFRVVALSEFVGRLERGDSVAGLLAITFDDGYRDNFEDAAPVLRRHGLEATFFVTSSFPESQVVPWWDEEMPRPPEWMSWDQVRQLREQGFEIGAHTRTHLDLGVIEGVDAEQEIAGARQDLEGRVGGPVDLFAYPYGRAENISADNRERARQAGFRCCASCHGGLPTAATDPFQLPRVAVSSWYISPYHFGMDLIRGRA